MDFIINDKYGVTIPNVKTISTAESAYVSPIYDKCIMIQDLKNAIAEISTITESFDSGAIGNAFAEISKYPDAYKSVISAVDLIVRSIYDESVRELIDKVYPLKEFDPEDMVTEDTDNEQYNNDDSDVPVLFPDEDEAVDETEESEEEYQEYDPEDFVEDEEAVEETTEASE